MQNVETRSADGYIDAASHSFTVIETTRTIVRIEKEILRAIRGAVMETERESLLDLSQRDFFSSDSRKDIIDGRL